MVQVVRIFITESEGGAVLSAWGSWSRAGSIFSTLRLQKADRGTLSDREKNGEERRVASSPVAALMRGGR